MLQILSDFTKLNRLEKNASAWVLASGQTGTFVSFSANDGVDKPSAGDAAVAIFTESSRTGDAGSWVPSVSATGTVTVVHGSYVGRTDQFTGSPAVNDPLYVDANGKLSTTSAGNAVKIGVCTKASASMSYLGRTINVIEFVTV